jgi:glyoxylase-like metal-dependent hydrolase (beta-lactamase superfamily II)
MEVSMSSLATAQGTLKCAPDTRSAFVVMTWAVLAACQFATAQGAAPFAKIQAPGFYRMMVGDIEVTALNDGVVPLPVDKLLTNVSPEDIRSTLARVYLTVPLETSFNGFLVNTGSKLVLIDTGAGTLMGPGTGRLVINLRAAGYQPDQVDEIYITHMHLDHVGGLTFNGQRVFSNAIVRAAKPEGDYWLSPAKMAAAPSDEKTGFQNASNSLDPYVKAGKFHPFEGDVTLVPGVRAVGTHGHTPGHTSYVVESQGKKLVVIGDLVHVGAVQFPNPSITIKFDTDSNAAKEHRERTFRAAAAEGYWIAGAHLSFPGIGHLKADQGGYEWIPVNYSIPSP